MKNPETVYKTFLANCHEKNLSRSLINIVPLKSGKIKVNGNTYLNVSSNDYLGLKDHPRLKQASQAFVSQYGSGTGASRLVTGNIAPFEEIETKIASIKGKEAALILASGFQANGSILQALFDKSILKNPPTIVSDRLNHASMHFGCAAAGVRQKRYHHRSAAHAETLLTQAENAGPSFCLTETVFSMDGDIAPIDHLSKIASTTGAMLIADDAHGFGVLGDDGQGLGGAADLIIGTFSKAMGSFGAYVAASQTIIDFLIQRCGGLIYSTALPPATLGAINASLDMLPELETERQKVANHAARFRHEMQVIGYDTGSSETQIVPLIIGKTNLALELSNQLRANAIWATAIRPPTVPEGTARLRFAFSAAHSEKDIDHLINTLKKLKKNQGEGA